MMVAPDGDLAGVVPAHAVIPSQGAGHLRRRSGTWQGMQTSVTISHMSLFHEPDCLRVARHPPGSPRQQPGARTPAARDGPDTRTDDHGAIPGHRCRSCTSAGRSRAREVSGRRCACGAPRKLGFDGAHLRQDRHPGRRAGADQGKAGRQLAPDRSSSGAVRSLTSCRRSGTGRPRAVVLLGQHVTQRPTEADRHTGHLHDAASAGRPRGMAVVLRSGHRYGDQSHTHP